MNDIYIWQQDIWQKLTKSPEFQGHAVLLKGKQGIGKYDFARQWAKSLLCTAPTAERKACDECPSCGWFEQNSHPNFYPVLPQALRINAAGHGEKEDNEEKPVSAATRKSVSQHIGVEQIRQLNDFVYMTGHQEGYKIILIYPAEAMNTAAANALLKKLEEPPENVLFILVAHQTQRLLPTIRSRCQQIVMPVPDVQTSVAWLKQQYVNDPQTSLAAAGFSPLMALLLDKGEHAAHYEQFLEYIGNPHRLDPISLAEALQQMDLSVIVNWLQKWCYDLISYRITETNRFYPKQLSTIKILSGKIDLLECLTFTRSLNSKQPLSHHPLNSRLFLEDLFIDYVAMFDGK